MFSSGSQSCFCSGESGNPRLFIIVLKQLFFGTSSQKPVCGSTNKYRKNLGNESRMLHGGLIADLIVLEIGRVFENVTYSLAEYHKAADRSLGESESLVGQTIWAAY